MRNRAALLLLLTCFACTPDHTTIAGPGSPATAAESLLPNAPLHRLAITAHGPETLDEYYARLSDSIPGFAGFYFDNGDPVVALTNIDKREVALTKLRHLTQKKGSARRARIGTVRLKKAMHDFKTLHRWRQWIDRNLMSTEGVVLTDIDEANNRIRVGVVSAPAASRVREAATRQGIPIELEMIDPKELSFATRPSMTTPPIRSTNARITANDYLYSDFTSKPGGIQIERGIGGQCTLGFNAYKSSTDMGIYDHTQYFVTNAHCTNQFPSLNEATEQTSFGQPTRSSGLMGFERREPIWRRLPELVHCPPTLDCALADVALVEYTGGARWELGKIAQTTFAATGNVVGSREINPLSPRFTIVDSMELFPLGIELDRVSIESGWVYGRLAETCTHSRVFTRTGAITNVMLLCQGTINVTARPGDSGSPVFRIVNFDRDEVALAGIVWGGGQLRTRFSYYPYISYELTHRDKDFACFHFLCWPRLTVSAP